MTITSLVLFLLCLSGVAAALPCVNASTDMAVNSGDGTLRPDQRILPVIMYHQVLKSRHNRYTVTPAVFERDLIELKKRGYTTVLPSEVIRFAAGDDCGGCSKNNTSANGDFAQKKIGGGEFPQKPIMITFDDGHYNNLHYCRDILSKYGCKAVVNVVGAYSEQSSADNSNPMYSYLTWEQIAEMSRTGIFEIGNHTYNMHSAGARRGILPKKGESDDAYRLTLTGDIVKLQNKLKEYGVTAQCFAYPFGSYNRQSKQILLNLGFKMLFTCTERRSVITANNPKSLHEICRFNRNSRLSSEEFFNKIEKSQLKGF